MILDAIDQKLLRSVQSNSGLSIAELAERVGLSASACHRRLKLLETRGVIERYVALLDRKALGFAMEFFVEVSLNGQSEEVLDAFEGAVRASEEILECHLMAGGTDYVLRVVARDVADFERIHRERLARLPHVSRLQSNLAIRTVRAWSGYPV